MDTIISDIYNGRLNSVEDLINKLNQLSGINHLIIDRWLSSVNSQITLNIFKEDLSRFLFQVLMEIIKSEYKETLNQIKEQYGINLLNNLNKEVLNIDEYVKNIPKYPIIYKVFNMCKYLYYHDNSYSLNLDGRKWYRRNLNNIKQIFMEFLDTLPTNIVLENNSMKVKQVLKNILSIDIFNELRPVDINDEDWKIMYKLLIKKIFREPILEWLQEYAVNRKETNIDDKILDKLTEVFINNFDIYLSKTKFSKTNNVYDYTYDDEDYDTLHDLSNIADTFRKEINIEKFCSENKFDVLRVKNLLKNFEKYLNSDINQMIYTRVRNYLIKQNIKTVNKQRGEFLLALQDDDKINVLDSIRIDFDPHDDGQRDRPIVITRNGDTDYILFGDFGVSHTAVMKDPDNAKYFENDQSGILYKMDRIDNIQIAFAYYLGHIVFVDKSMFNSFTGGWDEVIKILKKDNRIRKVYSCDKVKKDGGPITRLAKKLFKVRLNNE